MSNGIKLSFMPLGSITLDTNALVAFSTRATVSNQAPVCKFEPFPVWAAYIETPTKKILFDTGLCENCLTGGESAATLEKLSISFKEGENLEHQLGLCGVKPEDIDYVIISHLHHDHAGKIGLFKNAKIIVQRQEMIRALLDTHTVNPMGTYLKADLEVSANWTLIDGDVDFMPGVKLLLVPGHAEGQQALQLELDRLGTVLLTSDACYTELNWGPPMRPAGALDDSKAYFASLKKLHAIAEATNATVFFGHDIAQFETLRKAPDYYD